MMAIDSIRFGGIGIVIFSDYLTQLLGDVQMPPLWNQMRTNKVQSCLFLMFFGGTLSSNLEKTGAFEIYFDGHKVTNLHETQHLIFWNAISDQIFSKLEENRLPHLDEITTAMDRILQGAKDPAENNPRRD